MTFRHASHVPGNHAWIVDRHPYPVRCGLSHGTVVTIVAQSGQQVEIEDAGGRRHTLQHWQVDSGTEWEVRPGQWIPESNPKLLTWLEKQAQKYRAERWQAPVEGSRKSAAESLEEIVQRQRAIATSADRI